MFVILKPLTKKRADEIAQIPPCVEKFLKLNKVAEKVREREITLREAAGKGVADHQGSKKCDCRSGSNTRFGVVFLDAHNVCL